MRRTLSVLAAAVVAFLSAQILGEYELRSYVPYLAGVLFGLVIAEVVVSVGAHRDLLAAIVAAAGAGGGLGWGTWLSTSEGLEPWPALGWVAIALGVVVAAGRAGSWRTLRTSAGGGSSTPMPGRRSPRTPRS